MSDKAEKTLESAPQVPDPARTAAPAAAASESTEAAEPPQPKPTVEQAKAKLQQTKELLKASDSDPSLFPKVVSGFEEALKMMYALRFFFPFAGVAAA
jgi:hypothetical protein